MRPANSRIERGPAGPPSGDPGSRIPRQLGVPFPPRSPDGEIPPRAKSTRTRGPVPSRNDAVFRLAAAWFAVWVVSSAITSPVTNLRPSWWPIFLAVGAIIALGMLVGACMTVGDYFERGRR